MLERRSLKLTLVLVAFVLLWLITSSNPGKLNILWFVVSVAISTFFILGKKNITWPDVAVGAFLALLATPSSPFMGAVSIVSYLGGVSVFKERSNGIPLLRSRSGAGILRTFLLMTTVGGVLGALNIYLAQFNMEINPSLELKWLLDAMQAGVMEEITFRFLFFAICVYVTNDKIESRSENILCYCVMVIPHVLLHLNLTDFDIGGLVILSLVFGLPFAVLQRKHDLTSAIGAHALVDVMRFAVFGA